MSRDAPIDLAGALLHETDSAILFSETGDRKGAVWLPKSQLFSYDFEIEPDANGHHVGEISLPKWLAQSKGLI